MTYRDELNQKTSFELYRMLSQFDSQGGELEGADNELYLRAAESKVEDESDKDVLVELVERLHNDDLL